MTQEQLEKGKVLQKQLEVAIEQLNRLLSTISANVGWYTKKDHGVDETVRATATTIVSVSESLIEKAKKDIQAAYEANMKAL